MLEGSRMLDAPPHHISATETIEIAKGYEFLVLFTSTPGWTGDQKLAEAIKKVNPNIRIAFVGPPVTTSPDRALNECAVIDFVCRREFDFSVVEYANGKPLDEILGISFRKSALEGRTSHFDLPKTPAQAFQALRGAGDEIIHNPDRPQVEDLDAMPWVTDIYNRDMDV